MKNLAVIRRRLKALDTRILALQKSRLRSRALMMAAFEQIERTDDIDQIQACARWALNKLSDEFGDMPLACVWCKSKLAKHDERSLCWKCVRNPVAGARIGSAESAFMDGYTSRWRAFLKNNQDLSS